MRKIYFYLLLVCLLFVIAGCTTFTNQVCGDGICGAGESVTCSSDCASTNNQPNLPTATISAPDTANVNDQITVTATITGGTAPYSKEFFKCSDITDPAVTMASQTPWTTIRCTYTSPSQYKIVLQGQDANGNVFSAYKYITITSSSQLQPATYKGFVNPSSIDPPIQDPGQVTGQATSQLPTRYVIAKISGTEKARATIGTNGDYTITVQPPSSPDPIITAPPGGFYVYFYVLDNGKEYPAGQYIFKSGQTITYDLHYSTASQPQTETIYGYVNPSNSITANAVSQPPNTVKVTAKISGVTKATAYAYPNNGYYTFDVQGYVNDKIDFYIDDVFIKSVTFTGTRTKVDLTTQTEQPKNWEIFKGFINPIRIDPPPQIPPQSINSINCGTKIKLSAKIAGAEVGYTCVNDLETEPYEIKVNYLTPTMPPFPLVEFYIGSDKYGESYYHGNGITTTLDLNTPVQEPKDYQTFTGRINPPPGIPPSQTTGPIGQKQLIAKIGTTTVGSTWVEGSLNNVPYTLRVDKIFDPNSDTIITVEFYIGTVKYGSATYTDDGKTTTLNLYTPAQNIPTASLEMPLVAVPNQLVTVKVTVNGGTTPYTITSFKCKNSDVTTYNQPVPRQPPQTVFYLNCSYSNVGNYTASVSGYDANAKTFSDSGNIEVLSGGITQIQLKSGWNLITIPQDSYADLKLNTIFGNVLNNINMVYTIDSNEKWLVWRNKDRADCTLPPRNPACDAPNNLAEIDFGRAYFVNANNDFVLDLSRIPKRAYMPSPVTIQVYEGYNFIGVSSKFPRKGDFLTVDYKAQAWTFDPGQNKWVLIAISSAYDFTPGVGYAINFNKAGEVAP